MRRIALGLFLAAISAVTAAAQTESLRIDEDGTVHIPQLRVGALTVDETLSAPELRTRAVYLRHEDDAFLSWGEWKLRVVAFETIRAPGRVFEDEAAAPRNLVLSLRGPNNGYGFLNTSPGVLYNSFGWISDDRLQRSDGFTDPPTVEVSDARLKSSVAPLTAARFDALRPVTYRLRTPHIVQGGGGRQIGFLADEVERIYPELVFIGADGYRRLKYGQMTAVLTAALQQSRSELAEARTMLDTQERRLAALERRLSALEAEAAVRASFD
jgi:hypothetical protein